MQQHLDSLMSDESALRDFVQQIPKGADLHNHISGGVSIDKFMQWAAADGFCADPADWLAVAGPCTGKQVPLANIRTDQNMYAAVLSSWSMEGHKNDALLDRHAHFFATFDKFDAVLDAHWADSIADMLATAGKNHQTYIEGMRSLGSWDMGTLADNTMDANTPFTEQYLLDSRNKLLADGSFQTNLAHGPATFEQDLAKARTILKCDTPDADPGCKVDLRYVMEAYRTMDSRFVYGQWVYGYELAQKEPLVVGVNLVSPEEDPTSLKYYDDEMLAISVLEKMNDADASRRKVHVSLHAGELIPQVLPQTADGQKNLTFHVNHAALTAHAERIGHGTDILDEVKSDSTLLQDLASRNVLFEVCLSSSSLLLGYEGDTHPLNTLIQNNVPVALSTDDQGIFRTTITDDWLIAIEKNHLSYVTLKKLARASLEHSFLPGADLWAAPGQYDKPVPACGQDKLGDASASQACKDDLNANEHAAMQWKLEGEISAFEASVQ